MICPCCGGTGTVPEAEIETDGFRYIPDSGIFFGERRLRFTPSIGKLVGALMRRPGYTMTISNLLQYVGSEGETDHMVQTWISLARQLIRKETGMSPIHTAHGYSGYYWQV